MAEREIEMLKRLIGNWSVYLTAKMPDGISLKGKGTARATELSLDRGIHTEIRADVEGMGAYHEDDLWGYDQWEKKIHFYSITSSGPYMITQELGKTTRLCIFDGRESTRGNPRLKMSPCMSGRKARARSEQ